MTKVLQNIILSLSGPVETIKVEWDSEKEELNRRKHGISFSNAAKVFADPDRIEIYDRLHSIDEDRFVTIGFVNDVLFVVYTQRGDSTRIISARKATTKERLTYYER